MLPRGSDNFLHGSTRISRFLPQDTPSLSYFPSSSPAVAPPPHLIDSLKKPSVAVGGSDRTRAALYRVEVTQKEEKSGEVAAGKSGLQSDFGRTTPKNLHLPPHACKIKELKNDGTAPRAVAAVTFIAAAARSSPKIFPISRMVIVLLPPFVGWGYYPQSSMGGEKGLEGRREWHDSSL